jgi:hypothetical protein
MFHNHHPQRHRIEHILVVLFFPSPILGKIDLKLRVLGDDYPCHLLFARPAVSADKLFDRARGIAYHLKSFPSSDGPYHVDKDIQKGSVPVVEEEGFFKHQNIGFKVLYQSEDYPSSFLQGLVRRFFLFDRLDPVIDELSFLHEGDAHLPGAGVDGQDFCVVFGHFKK